MKLLNNENSNGSVVIEILSFRQKNLTTLYYKIGKIGKYEEIFCNNQTGMEHWTVIYAGTHSFIHKCCIDWLVKTRTVHTFPPIT